MNINPVSSVIALGLYCSVTAEAAITVTGGSGSPLSISFSSPPSFTVTAPIDHDTNGRQLYLVISDIMSTTENNFDGSPVSTSLPWTNNGAGGGNSTDNSITVAVTTYDFVLNDIAPTDLWIWMDASGQSLPGDVISFSSVQLSSTNSFSSVIPSGATVDVFLTDASGNLASNILQETIAVPEPSAMMFLLLGVAPMMRRRRTASL